MIDVNQEQRRASNPLSSVWVSASAGSGKTKVLTDRVLNLLLLTGRPDKILCLTFTKAAAAEMSNRINGVLKKWVICTDSVLQEQLETLIGETPDPDMMARARRLFASVLEVPGGLKMMTIHAFAQSVLKRFPLEAGIPPNFDVADENMAQTLLKRCVDAVMNDDSLQDAFRILAPYKTQDDLISLLNELIDQREKLLALRGQGDFETLILKLKEYFNISKYHDENEIISEHFKPEEWPGIADELLTKNGTINRRKKKSPLAALAPLAEETSQNLRHWKLLELNRALLQLTYAILGRYQQEKQAIGVLDFADLIAATKRLLSRNHAAAWVLFKLDGGLDHILVDEAQDTSPDQWLIVQALAEEFFAGDDGHETVRTLFVVGDRKQSIFSFQGADPDVFEQMRQYFEHRITASENDFQNVPFNWSFRSTRPILEVVNRVLENDLARAGVLASGESAVHISFREQDAGLVEIWPLEEHQKTDEPEPWKPPVERTAPVSAATRLAHKIADQIADMIRRKEMLESVGRPVRAGDFLILVQRRTSFVPELVRCLKDRNVPVAGVDRLKLRDHIAVQDLMAAARFALLPEDDLNLACLLKSPLFRLTEDDLFQIAYNRGSKTVWDRVRELYPDTAARLMILLNRADKVPPYEFFAYLLGPFGGRQRFMARLGTEAGEALDEFLNFVLTFDQNETPSLQHFMDTVGQQKMEIKRDMDNGQQAVRIMTVHGSKGLQGRIVFLPQTRYIKPHNPPILWLQDKWPFWVPTKSVGTLKTEECQSQAAALERAENHRLLYVALTRASDRLYICGFNGGTTVQPDNWYDLVRQSLPYQPDADGVIRVKSPQTGKIKSDTDPETSAPVPLPAWALKTAPTEPIPPRPLAPSKPENTVEQNESPLAPGQSLALERGRFMHQLLQYLPTMNQDKWPAMIERLKPTGIDLPKNVIPLLTSPQFAPIFGPDSLAEVPIVGVWKNRVVSGQIDRLIVRSDSVWIVDFKTNLHVPETVEQVPMAYREQLRAYRALITNMYPDRTVQTFLLWTENMTLMEMPDEN